MNIAQKIEESTDTTRFTLYREGLFYKCYNENAMVFSKRVKPYKVSANFIKSVNTVVLSLGFPVSEVEKGSLKLLSISESIGAESYKEESHGIVFLLKENIKQNYDEYKEAIINAKNHEVKKDTTNDDTDIQKLVRIIKNYDLANSTPMEGIAFIQELKSLVQKNNHN